MNYRGLWHRWKRVVFLICGALVVLYTLWTMTRFVMAFQELKRAHIFATSVVAVGWDDSEHARAQELSGQASFGSFTRENAASISIVGVEPRLDSSSGTLESAGLVIEEVTASSTTATDASSTDPVVATTTSSVSSPEPKSATTPFLEAPSSSSAAQNESSSDVPPVSEQAPLLVAPSESAAPSGENAAPLPTPDPVEQSVTTSFEPFVYAKLKKLAATVASYVVTTAFASSTPSEESTTTTASLLFIQEGTSTLVSTTTSDMMGSSTEEVSTGTTSLLELLNVAAPKAINSTPSDPTDIASCSVLGKECHTITFSGFLVEGSLKEKKLHDVELNFSFANFTQESELEEGKLLVRYFHNGGWHSGGEIFLNKELSNGTNGGYFTSKLEGFDRWDDLSDVKVVVEYVHGDDDSSAEVYLDAVWLDAVYQERAQTIIAGEGSELPTDVPANVQFALQSGNPAQNMLVLPDGGHITFFYIDDLDEDDLDIRVDKQSYASLADTAVESSAGGSVVYVSVTNTSDRADTVHLMTAFPQGQGAVREIAQFMRNVPISAEEPIYQDVAYLCESGWHETTSISTFVCAKTQETQTCAALNDSKTNCVVASVPVDSQKSIRYESTWVDVGVNPVDPREEDDVELPPGYVVRSGMSRSFEILPGQTEYFRVSLDTDTAAQHFVLYAKGAHLAGDLDSSILHDERTWRADENAGKKEKNKKDINKTLSTKESFDGDELPSFRFRFTSQRSVFAKIGNFLLGRSNGFSVGHARLQYGGEETEDIPIDVEYGENGEWTLVFKEQPRAFRPGRYTIEITVQEDSQTYVDTVDFYWGVLAVNTNKTLYEPGEQVSLMMAALGDSGETLCDAILDLSIADPAGVVTGVPVRQSGKCGPDNVVDVADYLAEYVTRGVGAYQISLTHMSNDGEVLHRISDSFEVREEVPFSVERTGPTRIYPKAPYTMEFTIRARRSFTGVVTEALPVGTLVVDNGGGDFAQYGGALRLSWNVSLKEGEEKKLRYTFDAPDISPYLYIFGPLEMQEGNTLAFKELRTWKVASDALGGYVEKNDAWSPTVASAWETVDLSGAPYYVPANAVAEIAIVNADVNNAWRGGVRHASSSLSRFLTINRSEPQGVGEFTMHVQTSATSSIQTYAQSTTYISFVLLGYWTDGYYVELFNQIDPNSADATWGTINLNTYGVSGGQVAEMIVGNWNTANERTVGVRQLGSSLNRYANIHQSTTSGVNGVSMLVRASTTNASIQGYAQVEGTNNADGDYWLAGYWSVNPTGLNYTERFDDLTGPTTNSTWTVRALDSYGVPSKAVAETLFGNGSATAVSLLMGVRAAGSTIDRVFNVHEAAAGGWVAGRAHVQVSSTASSTIEYISEDSASDVFRLLGYWSTSNYPPNEPTLYDHLFESEKTGTSTPSFRFSATDPDGTSDIVYEFEWDDDPVIDDAPLGSYASNADSGFSNITTPADTSPFNEGEQVAFTIPTALVSGTTYYWRVRAIDVSGSNIESEWTDAKSFTYVANTEPSQWMQTQDAQFDQDVLSNVETYGNNSVRLLTSAPKDVLVAYGEGTVQTPRYRIWNGTNWGSQQSALSVGGTIQWMMVKAGTTRDEYILGTQDDLSDVNVQVYNGTTGTWGNLQEMTTTVSNAARRGFDVAYETNSGDALAVYCDGDADPSYRVWNGSSWSAPATINLNSTTNCEWIRLASDPTSDEIIVVSRNTGTQYEAQVWNGSSWGNSVVLGSMQDVAHEGIAVEYEESGNQAVVAVSNGMTSGFVYSSWDGVAWSVATAQALGDDFEWGVLKHDAGSDNMAMCYSDEDDDLGIIRWDGSGWQANQEFETSGNTGASGKTDGRPVSCEFETTSGRDGYLMIPYSDTTNGRFQYWNGSAFSGESTISTIEDSWTVASARAGDGKIVTFFHDDSSGRYDSSAWNGFVWSPTRALNNNPSVTADPFREPITMAAKVYRPTQGTITTAPINFSLVSGQPSWGEVLWNTTEPAGTSVKLQVLYSSGGVCSSLVPDSALPGNSTGFAATSSSPLNLSALSTSTYSGLCLRATLSTTNTNTPTLTDWTLTWERQPFLSQEHFRWYANAASTTLSDPWPAGGSDLGEDEELPTAYAPSSGEVLRLRMSVLDQNVDLSGSNLTFRLQYAAGSTCSADMTWLDVGAVGSTTAAWRGYDNAAIADGAALPTLLLASSTARESYEESNDSVVNPIGIPVDGLGEWDWVIQHNASSSMNYCFRMVTGDGLPLNAYSVYPSLVTNSAPYATVLNSPFDNEMIASTTPWFEFVAEDPEGDDVTYQIQIDDNNTFGSPLFDRNSQTHFSEFSNSITPSDKDPFTSGEVTRFIPTSALSNGSTYYWRVRAKDRTRSNEWGPWSSTNSVTINTSVTITSWRQTMMDQFNTDSLDDTEATSTNDVVLTPGFTVGTTTSTAIDFDWKTTGNAWGSLSWTDNETLGTIRYHVEYLSGDTWSLVPDTDLPGNAAGFTTSPISLLGLSPSTYDSIRLRTNFTQTTGTPRLQDWTVQWGYAVEQPTLIALFDNEKTATTTPTFTFTSSDPQGDDIVYQISISTTNDFAASTTRSSDSATGFTNLTTATDTSPFISGNSISFKVQAADALSNGQTYWWRVRARDPSGGNVWSVWSPSRSFTVDTAVNVSTWFQTTDAQFLTNTLQDTEVTGSGGVQITTITREAFVAYAEGTVQAPRYRIWNGSSWGTELSGEPVGDTIRFVESSAAPTRDEYLIATAGSTGRIKVQVYNGTTDTTGNTVDVSTSNNVLRRGFDIAYETDSGDAMIVGCYGTEATYRIWNGTSWSASTTIPLAVSGNCEWVKLASDPTSDEIILVVRDTAAGAIDYQALVWNGSSWGNSMTMGSQSTVADEGIAVEYEESGGQAVVVVSNGTNNNFIWNSWNGFGWSGTATVAIGNDFAGGRIVRDEGTDALALCYTDVDNDIGIVRWSGSAWNTYQEFETLGNSYNGRPISCEYETTTGRDGYLMIPYSDTTQAEYVYWNGSTLSTSALLTTISDAWEVRTARTGDGNILTVAYDDANTEYDFTYWNGFAWSAEQVLETNSIASVTPRPVPIDIVARRYPAFNSGSVISSPIQFSDGSGPKWGSISFTDTTPGSSDILYQVEYLTATSSWALIPDSALPGNSVGSSTSPISLSNVNRTTYSTIRLRANLLCNSGDCPTLNDWTLTWSEGIPVSGTIKAYDQTTNVATGTVAVAVNGVLQVGKTGTISGGTWTIPNVTVFGGDVVTVFVTGAGDANEAVGVTTYDGDGDITGIELFEKHLSLGSDDNPILANTDVGQYDNSVSGNEDVYHEVDAGSDLTACRSTVTGCSDVELWVRAGTTYRPDSGSSGNVSTYNLENNGTIIADGNTFTLSGSWDNNATFTHDTSTVVFSATSSIVTIDSTGATTDAFNNVTIGQSASTARVQLVSPLNVDGNLTLSYGYLDQNVSRPITIGGNLTIGASGGFIKGTASTTFDGTGTSYWTDNAATKVDMGNVFVDGSIKTLMLGSSVKATNMTIGADDTLNANTNYSIEVLGDWVNNNSFVAQSGTVLFAATSTGHTITPGGSNFYNLTFDGVGGNWSFTTNSITTNNDLTITNGTLTLPTGTTTVGGNFNSLGGSFMHNNGVMVFNAATAKTVRPGVSSFYDVTFSGSGSWSFPDAHATSSRNLTITTGSVTLPSGTLTVGGSFAKNGGSFTANSGILKFTSATAQTIRFNNSSPYDVLFAGSGSWTVIDTNATSSRDITISSGTVTLPSGTLAIGGSFENAGAFTHNNGTVRFFATSTGKTITSGNSSFYNFTLDSSTGGWTITGNATSTHNTSLLNAASFTLSPNTTLSVGGTFTNAVDGSATTWTDSTLSLNSGTAYSLNTKTTTGDTYGALLVGANTDIRMWNSSAATTIVDGTGSLYSQDHAAVDGDLYLWGEYANSGNENWSYATDFDGTALTATTSRQVDVRIAANANVTIGSGVFRIVGDPAATTTIANQGSGSYAFNITGGILTAQYYQIKNTNTSGLNISGTPTIASLSDGDYELSVPTGGTSLTIAASVIDQNPALQIERARFATSSGVTSGSNVTEVGSPSSYWWFRNEYGNFAGENYDTDPGASGGNPGYIRWDDSNVMITVSGHVYSDHGSTPIGSPTCDGATPVITLVVSGGGTYTGSCNASTGAFSISGVSFTGDIVLTGYLNTGGGKRAVTVTKTPTADITNFDIYENALVVRHEDSAPITNVDLAAYDSSDDIDIPFTASTGTLITAPNTELYIWTGNTFAPGGNVTVSSGGSGDARDGRLYLANNAMFAASGVQTHLIGGSLIAGTGATLSSASSTFVFAATTSGKSILSASPLTFYNLTFNGAGGSWSLDSGNSATTTVQHTFAMDAGTLTGTGDMVIESGVMSGSGVVALTGGTTRIKGTGNFGSASAWQFYNLIFGNGVATDITSKTGVGTTTVAGTLTVAPNHTLNAGDSAWVLSHGGTPFVISGTFNVENAPFTYTATSSTYIAHTTYRALTLAPGAAGSPTYTLQGGSSFVTDNLTIGGTYPVTVTADTNDPSLNVTGDFAIASGSTFVASNVGAFDMGGSWTNNGTFTHSSGTVRFVATTSGKTITPGTSNFYNLTFDSTTGGWTIAGNATSTHDLVLLNAASFTLSPTMTLSVGGTFTNNVGGSATTWTNSILSLTSGTNYTLNTKTVGGDTYGTLIVGANTDIRMWDSSAATTSVNSTGSLYSQNHAGVNGDLYIWGEYARSTGSDYWSYATDFDGTALTATSSRRVQVRVASSSSLTFSGGVLDILGVAGATTTIAHQGTGHYSFTVSGGSLNAMYYAIRNTTATGLTISGAPTITSLSYGDFELDIPTGASMMTVAGSAINANPLKIIMHNRFATSSGVISGANVTATGSSGSSWKFNLHYGGRDGESYDADPEGDPGLILWDDSASAIGISGHVYSSEGSGVSSVCDGTTQVVHLMVQGVGSFTTACTASTGAFSIAGITFNPGDTLTLYLDTNGGPRAANVSVDPITTINNMDLYENRVIVRHEDSAPITIADMALYDSSDDSDIPFTAINAGTDTLTLPVNTKLIVWDSKTFAPAGNITLQSGGTSNAWDAALEVRANGSLVAAGTQTHAIGGDLILGSGATLAAASSTFTFTATTTGHTITLGGSSLYNATFNGAGGNWAFAGSAASIDNDLTISNGTLTLTTGTTTIGGTFSNTGGSFMHNNGTVVFGSQSTGKTVRLNGSNLYNVMFDGVGGGWTFFDTNATTTRHFTVATGTIALPTGVLAVGGSFENTGVFTSGTGTVKMTSVSADNLITVGNSSFYNLTLDGIGGEWMFTDLYATTTNNMTITNGSTTLPSTMLTIGGSFVNAGTFNSNNGTVRFNATATGKSVTAGSSSFYDLSFDSTTGGWTITGNATSTHDVALLNAASFTLSPSAILTVGGTFTNTANGSATTWTNSILSLTSGTNYTLNTKTSTGDTYGTLIVGANTDIRMWNSSAATTTVDSTGSLYSQDHANINGDLYIWGAYARGAGTDYWSYATDFDGAALTATSSRQVDVRIASSSLVDYSSAASLEMIGTASATTTVRVQGTGHYAFTFSGATLNANYYELKHINSSGLALSGTPAITSLSHGDYELDIPTGGTMLTVAAATIDANASLQITGVRFATSSGVTSGWNVTRTGSPISAWTFLSTQGNYAGESFDNDGVDGCGSIRWNNSSCLFVNQGHYRWRNDDGGEGVPSSEWYSASWSKRKKVAITNPNTVGLTNYPVKLTVTYDADMQSDFDDLRFTSSDGTTALSYWIEEVTPSSQAIVWVEVPTIYAEDAADVYMYYGNASVGTTGSGTSTFAFFDDFEDGNISEYSGDGASRFSVGSSFNHNYSYGLGSSDPGNFTTNGLYRTGSLSARGDTIRFFQYIDTSSGANGGQDDEPCTLFGVQSSGNNYAVCLDQYPDDVISISRNVTSRDSSGTILASTTVAYAQGWYEVQVDWLTGGVINVTVYDNTGSVFATTTVTDTTYSSGGVGFTYWGQHGGWDFYSVRQYVGSSPTSIFGLEQGSGGATWKNAFDTPLIGLLSGQNVRLRFSIQNSGSQIINQLFGLQYAPKESYLNCESVPYINYQDVPIAGSCGSAPACMSASSHFVNQAGTSGLLPYSSYMNFVAGQMLEDSSNQTSSMTMDQNTATEIEYNFQVTNNAVENAYCFRVANDQTSLDNYAHVAEAIIAHGPQISNIALNNAQDIALTEGATTTIQASCTVTDLNGYSDIVSATSTIYRSGVGPTCSANTNNCYPIASSSCAFSNCSGNSCTLTCSAPMQYFADPTDTDSTYASENWLTQLNVFDSTGLSAIDTSFGVDLLTLYGLVINASNINFGTLEVGQNTGNFNAQTTVINTGNTPIGVQVAGTDLIGGGNTIPVGEQKFATTTFAYGSCSICQFLTGSATDANVNLSKPTSTSTPQSGDVYWGINIPNGTRATSYSGTNTFIATGL